MPPIRRGLRFLTRGLLLTIILVGSWLAIKPWIDAKPGVLFVNGPVYALIDDWPYLGEIAVHMSRDPFRLYHDTTIVMFATDANFDGVAEGPYGRGLFRLERSDDPQHVRFIDYHTGQVRLESAKVEWMPPPGQSVPPVSWIGNRLLLWPGPGQQPIWRRNEDFIVSLGMHLYLKVYAIYVAKIVGISLGIAFILIAFARLLDRGLKGIQRGHCSNCGYDLRGITSKQCPECGEAIKEDRLQITARG